MYASAFAMIRRYMRVIFDTDIGDDIDDIWALGLLLSCAEIQLELVTVCFADITSYKVKVLEYVLSKFGHGEVKIACGKDVGKSNTSAHLELAKTIPDKVYSDAVSEIKRLLDETDEKVYVIADGPLSNIAEFAQEYPQYRDRYEVIAMSGAYKRGYINQRSPESEFNVLMDVLAANVAFAETDITIMPLDVCRDIIVDGDRYQSLKRRGSLIAKEILNMYFQWQQNYVGGALKFDENISSSILYDVVPIHYLLHPSCYSITNDTIIVNEKGRLVTSEVGNCIKIATDVNKGAILDFVVAKLTDEQ